MSRHELKSRDKVTQKISRDGLIEVNETKGDINSISRREADFSLRGDSPERENLSRHERNPVHAAPRRQKSMFNHNLNTEAAYAAHTDKQQELADSCISGDTYKPEYDAVCSDNGQPQNPEPLNAQYHAPAVQKHERSITERYTDVPKAPLFTHEQPRTALQSEISDKLQFVHDDSAQAHDKPLDTSNLKCGKNQQSQRTPLKTENLDRLKFAQNEPAQAHDRPPDIDSKKRGQENRHTQLQTDTHDKLQFVRDEPLQITDRPPDTITHKLGNNQEYQHTPLKTDTHDKLQFTQNEPAQTHDRPPDAVSQKRGQNQKFQHTSLKTDAHDNPQFVQDEHTQAHAGTMRKSLQGGVARAGAKPGATWIKHKQFDAFQEITTHRETRLKPENFAPESALPTDAIVKLRFAPQETAKTFNESHSTEQEAVNLSRDSSQYTKPQPDSSAKLQSAPKKSKPEASQNAAHVTGIKSDKTEKQTASAGTKPAKAKHHTGKKTDKPPDVATGKTSAQAKAQTQHLKGKLPFRPVKTGVNAAMAYGHSKAFQAEDENAGTQAAHRAELIAETGIRTALRQRDAGPTRSALHAIRASQPSGLIPRPMGRFRLSFSRLSSTTPLAEGKSTKVAMQKRKIKRQYAQLARQKHKAAKLIRKANYLGSNAKKALTGIIRRHPAAAAVTLLIFLSLMVAVSLFGLASGIAGSGLNGILIGAYLAEEPDIEAAEISYTEWEIDLREEIENVESDHPGYDEYRYDIGDIGHSPHELMAYLTTEYFDFEFSDISGDLRGIFDDQYILTFTERVEIRYYYDDDEEEWVPYNWYVLITKLESKPLSEVLNGRMSADGQLHYTALMGTKGGRQHAGSPFAYDWLPYVTCNYGWRADPFTGEKSFHTGIDIGAPTGTQIISAHDGVVTSVVYGSTGYGYQTMIAGENGLSTRYAHCSALLVSVGQEVKAGDVIALVGSTGWSTGPHLHFEVIKDGEYLNPAYFAK